MHEITIRDDKQAEAMFAGNGKELVPAWHGLGTNVLDAPSSADAIRLAKLDWSVMMVQAMAYIPGPRNNYQMADDFRAIVRTDNRRVLGYVTDDYEPVQNSEAFDFLDNLNADRIVKYESAGSLRGGRKVWVLARTNTIYEVVPGDAVQPYILFTTSHDGSSSLRILPTTVRVVCANTLRIALGVHGAGFTVRHDGNVVEKLATIRDILKASNLKIEGRMAEAQRLAHTKLTKDAFQEFVDEVLPIPEKAKRPALRLQAREQVAWNFYSNPRQQLPGIERSAWAAYNAVSEMADHGSQFRGPESRFVSVIEGGADELKQHAFKTALSFV